MYIPDIDECTIETDGCDTNAACNDIDGSYTCTCNEGYTGDGYECSGESNNDNLFKTICNLAFHN